jgi:DMSO/TMAO reductase YedYZ molybdopterin-dependent catalytic subunit
MSAKLTWPLLGVAAAAVAIGVAEIVAGILGGLSVIAAVGAFVISLQPPGGKDLMVALFGTNDKLVLEIGTFLGGLLVGAILGLLGKRDLRLAYGGFAAFGLVAFFLLIQDPLEDMIAAVLTAGAAVVAGIVMVAWLASMVRPARDRATAGTDEVGAAMPRRAFLAIAAMFAVVGSVLAVVGRFLGGETSAPASGGTVGTIPAPSETVPPVPSGADFGLSGMSPIIVPNDDFYLIDTRLTTPRINADDWSLRVHGMVDREVTLSYAQLLAMPIVERYVTISCVSNEVGGHLVGNAKWAGVSLQSVLDMAGIQPGATQIVGRSYDGWTSGFPTEHLLNAGHDAIIALEMNGEPLPARHGYPARTIVPGLYGFVSATKWITELELTTLEAFDAYWVRLGWAKQAPILTQSRIDLPRAGAQLTAGQNTVGGVAWAPTRGISKVEVQLDGGAWQPAELSVPLSAYSWIQWKVDLDVPGGPHNLRVRATDGTGALQDPGPTPPAPDGARGYHTISISAG